MVSTRIEDDGSETTWCPTCRRRRKVVDMSNEHTMTYSVEKGYTVWYLECEHQVSEENGDDHPHGIRPYSDRRYQ